MASEIGDRIRDRYNTAKEQIGEVQDKVVHSLTDVRDQVKDQVTDVPKELRVAWEHVLERLFSALDVPSRRDFNAALKRIDALERKLGTRRARRSTAKRTRN